MTSTAEKHTGSLRAPTLATLMRHPFPARDYLLHPWLRQGESAMLWAAPGVGKTMLSLSIALAVAGGGTLLGWQSNTPRKVLLVDGEMHAADLTERARDLTATVDGIDPEAAHENITVLARQFQAPEAEFPDLASQEGQADILKRVRELGASLVILDNFSTLAEVEDENAASAMTPVLRFLMTLKQAGVACLLVHHSGKGGESYRGSSKLATTFEAILGLRKLDASASRPGTAFHLIWEKYRGLRNEATRDRTVTLEVASEGVPARWTHELNQSEECVALVEAVRSLRFTTQAELAAHLGMSTGKLSTLKGHAMLRDRLITRAEWDGYLEAAREAREAGSTAHGEERLMAHPEF